MIPAIIKILERLKKLEAEVADLKGYGKEAPKPPKKAQRKARKGS